ncbi:dopamine N-acetyltransferase-like [Drosophila hydei]|uniref:aralkylamine N-acetyltransferase n=1 Tax=Drosophila hydei TaxID=7224 RepID=A0A6J1M9G4_DROHY|nr:dopamine N-acetyltransferase-like [Drosophila hydei]
MTTIVREMLETDIDEASCFFREHFMKHEPLLESHGKCLQANANSNKRELDESVVREGLSLVIVDQSRGDRIVGVAYAGVLSASELESSWNELKHKKRTKYMEHIKYFLVNIKRNAQFFRRYDVSKALYLKVLVVDASMQRQGLGRRLVTALIDVARAKGLALLVATCTGCYSTKLMASVGMECVHSENYCDFKDDDGNIVFKPSAPHTKASIMVLKL